MREVRIALRQLRTALWALFAIAFDRFSMQKTKAGWRAAD